MDDLGVPLFLETPKWLPNTNENSKLGDSLSYALKSLAGVFLWNYPQLAVRNQRQSAEVLLCI